MKSSFLLRKVSHQTPVLEVQLYKLCLLVSADAIRLRDLVPFDGHYISSCSCGDYAIIYTECYELRLSFFSIKSGRSKK